MADNNTIVLLHGWERLVNRTEMPSFRRGDTIWGPDSAPEEIKRWPIDDKADALAELKKYQCSYDDDGYTTTIDEYALMYFEADEDGDFVDGGDYDPAAGMLEDREPVYIQGPQPLDAADAAGCKSYRDYDQCGIGCSDISALTLTGGGPGGARCEMLKFGRDGSYNAYVVDEAAEIGQHYSLAAQFNFWAKIYDDQDLTFSVTGDEINIYRAGEMGCIIQVINKEGAK